MLSFLVLATTSGGALSPDATARLTSVPTSALTHQPETRTVWLSREQHVGFAGWQTRAELVGGSHWHAGDHGLTAITGGPWPVGGRFGSDTSWASQLTARLLGTEPAAVVRELAGVYALIHLGADGRGWVSTDVAGAGPVHVAEHDGLLAVSNRAELALDAVRGRRTHHRDAAVAGTLTRLGTTVAGRDPYRDATVLGADQLVRIDPVGGARIEATTPAWADTGPHPSDDATLDALAAQLRSTVAALAELPAPRRAIELAPATDARVVLAAAVAAGVVDRFELLVRGHDGDPDVEAARALARAAGGRPTVVAPVTDELASLDRSLREQVGISGAAVTADPTGGPPLAEDGLLLTSAAAAVLRPHADLWGPSADPAGDDPTGMLTADARQALGRWLDGYRSARLASVPDAGIADAFHLEHRLPRHAATRADLAAPAVTVDPTCTAELLRLGRAAGGRAELQQRLVERLSPELAAIELGELGPARPAWRTLYPLLEGELLGRPGSPLDASLERDAVRELLRGDEPTPALRDAVWAATTAAVWLSHGEAPRVVPRRIPEVRVVPRRPDSPPVILTGITSRSFIELAQLKIPLDRTERDPLLAVRVDREVAELTDRLLVAVDASLGDVPADLDERLASAETARFADPAVQLLARRGGILADPRLGLTLPFWHAHVATPQVVLVAERPTDLLGRLERPLPAEQVLVAWLDVVSATLTTTDGVRCVDPDDIAERPLGPEAASSAAYPGTDRAAFEELLSVTSVIDSLIRELEVEAVRPVVRELRRARLAARRPLPPRGDTARFPLAALDALTELRQRTGELEAEVAARAAERDEARRRLEELRARRSVRWALAAARALGRAPRDEP